VREEREAELKARRATAVRAPFRHSCAFVCRDEYLEEANASTMIRLAIWPPLRINTCRTLSTLNTSSSGVTRIFGYKTTYGRWTPTIVVGSPTAPPPRRPITHLSALACRTRTLTRPSAPTASAPPPNSLSTSLGSLSSSSSSPLASFIPIRTCLNVARHAGSSIPYRSRLYVADRVPAPQGRASDALRRHHPDRPRQADVRWLCRCAVSMTCYRCLLFLYRLCLTTCLFCCLCLRSCA
jgi:hypothetical protein